MHSQKFSQAIPGKPGFVSRWQVQRLSLGILSGTVFFKGFVP